MTITMRLCGLLALCLLCAGSARAANFEEDALASSIKTIAVMESVETVSTTLQHTAQKGFFRRTALLAGNDAPETFSAVFHTLDHDWQTSFDDGMVYFSPLAGEEAYVTVTKEGGALTTYEPLTPVLKTALMEKPETVMHGMGRAFVGSMAMQSQRTNRWYLYKIDKKVVGSFHVMTLPSDMAGVPLLYRHRLDVAFGDKEYSIDAKSYCRDDAYLSPVRMVSRATGEGLYTYDATITQKESGGEGYKQIDVTHGRGGSFSVNVPGEIVNEYVLFELMRTMPFQFGDLLKFNLLIVADLSAIPDQVILYGGRDDGEMLGATRPHHFMQKGDTGEPSHYWLDERRELVKVVWDKNKEFVLSTEREVKEALAARDAPE